MQAPHNETTPGGAALSGAAPAQLIESCQGLVRTIAWKIHQKCKTRVELDDLIAYGQLGLAEAASRYQSALGAQFSTYAYHRIRGAIFDGLSKMGWFSRAGYWAGRYERQADEVLAGVEAAAAAESGDAAGDPQSGNRWLMDVSARLGVVYLASGLGGGVQAADTDLEDPAADTPQAALIVRETRAVLRELVEHLPEQARALIRFVYFDGLTLTEAGERLRISKSWASRLHDRTLRHLALSLRLRDAELPAPQALGA